MKFLFKLTSRSRPIGFFKALDSIISNLTDKENYTILCTLDTDDKTMNTLEIKNKLSHYHNTVVSWGKSCNKIHAINRGIMLINDWEILINVSDDFIFIENGFDDTIRNDMQAHFADTDGCLHYNDGNQKDKVCSLSIMGKKYFNRFGYIYYPRYQSMFADDDFAFLARGMGRIKYMGDEKIIFKHLHPSFALADTDDQYKQQSTPEIYQQDAEIFELRRRVNFKL